MKDAITRAVNGINDDWPLQLGALARELIGASGNRAGRFFRRFEESRADAKPQRDSERLVLSAAIGGHL
jgi:hypothetical protein